jgi:hypothetical protein
MPRWACGTSGSPRAVARCWARRSDEIHQRQSVECADQAASMGPSCMVIVDSVPAPVVRSGSDSMRRLNCT